MRAKVRVQERVRLRKSRDEMFCGDQERNLATPSKKNLNGASDAIGKGTSALRDEKKVELGFFRDNKLRPRSHRNVAIGRKKKIVRQQTITTEPEVFNLNRIPDPVRRSDHSATAKVVQLFAALRIHALRNHVAPLGYWVRISRRVTYAFVG
jgi:hypothetical protein